MRARTRRFVVAATAVVCGAAAITFAASVGRSASPSAASAGRSCPAAGAPSRLALSTGAGAYDLAFGDQRITVAGEDEPTVKPAEVVNGVAVAADGSTAVTILDAKGPDRLLVRARGAGDWAEVFTGADLRYPAVSPDGGRIAFSAAGRLLVASAADGWKPAAVAAPSAGKHVVEYLRFLDAGHLLLTVEVAVPGLADDLAGLSDVWRVDLAVDGATASWTRLTSGVADTDRWSIARTPAPAADGSVLYVRATGLGSGSEADLRTELRRVSPSGVDTAVSPVADRWGIVEVRADGAILGSAPDERSRWRLELRDALGRVAVLGCGRASWAMPLNHDPDYAP